MSIKLDVRSSNGKGTYFNVIRMLRVYIDVLFCVIKKNETCDTHHQAHPLARDDRWCQVCNKLTGMTASRDRPRGPAPARSRPTGDSTHAELVVYPPFTVVCSCEGR